MKSIKIASTQLVKDPVCGMDVDQESAAGRYEHEGQTYFFCNPYCLEKFKAEPAKYLTHAPAITHEESEPRLGAKEDRKSVV